jgi:hypothetical protein
MALKFLGKVTVVVRNGEVRIEFNGAIEVGDGAVQIALGLIEVGDAAVLIDLGFFGKATVVVGTGVFRIKFDGAVVVGDGAVHIVVGLFGKAALVVVRRERGSLSCGDSRKHQTQNECDAH